MNVGVVGANGELGSDIVKAVLENGDNIWIGGCLSKPQ